MSRALNDEEFRERVERIFDDGELLQFSGRMEVIKERNPHVLLEYVVDDGEGGTALTRGWFLLRDNKWEYSDEP